MDDFKFKSCKDGIDISGKMSLRLLINTLKFIDETTNFDTVQIQDEGYILIINGEDE